MKRSFFQAAVVLIPLYGCTTWTLTKRLEKKLDGNYTKMLRAILNKSWWQHPTKHQLYGHLPPITKTIQVRRTRPAGHYWRSRDELISDVLLWTSTFGRAKAGWPAQTYIQLLCEDTGCSPEDQPEAMNDREKWRERVRDIHASGTTWWWWWWIVEMSGLTEKTFFGFIFTPWNSIEIFYETEIVQFSVITIEWPYPREYCWKKLSDFNQIKFYQHFYHCDGWLVGGLDLWHINLCRLFNAKSIFM